MNERNMEHPSYVVNPLFARVLGTDEVMVLAFPYRAGMRPAIDRPSKPSETEIRPDSRRN